VKDPDSGRLEDAERHAIVALDLSQELHHLIARLPLVFEPRVQAIEQDEPRPRRAAWPRER